MRLIKPLVQVEATKRHCCSGFVNDIWGCAFLDESSYTARCRLFGGVELHRDTKSKTVRFIRCKSCRDADVTEGEA